MGELTRHTPKPLLKLDERTTLLEHNLLQLEGIADEVIIVVGYLREQIIGHIGTSYKGMKITYVIQKEQRGTGDALLAVREYDASAFTKKFILMMGDDLYVRRDIQKCLAFDDAILVQKVADPSRFGVFVVNKQGIITKAVEKPKAFVSELANAALYVFSDLAIFTFQKTTRGEYEFTDLVKRIIKEKQVHAVSATMWIPIGTPEDLMKVRLTLSQ